MLAILNLPKQPDAVSTDLGRKCLGVRLILPGGIIIYLEYQGK
jgi:hypothetical protein